MPRSLFLAAALLAALLAGKAMAQDSIEVLAAPVPVFDEAHPEQSRFGALRYLGGLQLDSPDKRFGGLSGIEISPDGTRVLMVSDIGDLISATLVYDEGVLAGLSDVAVRRLTGPDGARLGDKDSSDAESLRATSGAGLPDDILIGFERDNRALRYRLGEDGRVLSAKQVALPAAVALLPYNKGLEGIAVVPPGAPHAGATIAFAESETVSDPGIIPGWMMADGRTRDLALKRTSDFDVTDVVALPDGDLIVLERQFAMLFGVAMRIRRVKAAELDGPQPMEGTTLLTAGMAHAVDNMEGMAVHRDAAGRTILTIVSDDNFNPLQRTLLLQFELL